MLILSNFFHFHKNLVSHGDTLFSPLFVKSQKNLVVFGLKEAQG